MNTSTHAVRRKKTKQKLSDRFYFQFVFWLKNDKHLLEHDTRWKRQSIWGDIMTSTNSIWTSISFSYRHKSDFIWWNSSDILPISSRSAGGSTAISQPRMCQRTRPLFESLLVWRSRVLADAWRGGGLSVRWLIRADIWRKMRDVWGLTAAEPLSNPQKSVGTGCWRLLPLIYVCMMEPNHEAGGLRNGNPYRCRWKW